MNLHIIRRRYHKTMKVDSLSSHLPFLQSNVAESKHNSNAMLTMMVVQTIDEDPATTPSIEFKPLFSTLTMEPPAAIVMPSSRSPTVRFNEEENLVHGNSLMYQEDCSRLWYTKEELLTFRQQAREHTQDLRDLALRGEDEIQVWIQDWTKAYQLLCDTNDASELKRKLPKLSTHDAVDLFTLGVERRVVPFIATDVSSRRKLVVEEVLECQATYPPLGKTHEQAIYEASRKASRPSRLYALHLAVTVSRMKGC